MILDNRRITIREVADVFTDVLGIKRAAAKIIPKLQNFDKNNIAWTSRRRYRFA